MMDVIAAGKVILPMGRYRGRPIRLVACYDDGLQYLDWLLGEIERESSKRRLATAISVYLKHPHNARRLEAMFADRS